MRGAQKGPFDLAAGAGEGSEVSAASRRLTPSTGLAPDSEKPDDAANEDFLFHLYRGSELLQDNRAHEAKEELERALHLQPHDAKGQDLLAVVYFRLGLYPRAISIYEQLRRTSTRDPALLLNLALCYLKTGQAGLARRDLEQLLAINPSHARAWGYLGLACERLGALGDAERAFTQGGHSQMARRMADRRASQAPAAAATSADASPARDVRDVVAAAYEELDAGELSFALAEPATDSGERSPDSWLSIELGQMVRTKPDGAPLSMREPGAESKNPDTKDGPPPVAALPQLGGPPSAGHRNTLMVGVAPPHDPAELEALSKVASPRSPGFVIDEAGAPSLRRTTAPRLPAVRVPGVASGPTDMGTYDANAPASKRTLPPPPVVRAPSAPSPAVVRPPTVPPPAAQLTRDSILAFPASGNVVIHASGVALVRTAPVAGFAARLEALRASSNTLTMKLLERHVKGKPTGESFGGASSPLVHATGEGQLVLGPRAGRKLSSFTLTGPPPATEATAATRTAEGDEMCFVREEVLLGFDGELAFENGRLATGEGEFVSVVQLRGKGAVLLEAIGEILTLEVQGTRGLSVRREVVLGWFGRLVPRALAPSEAPCGQRGLVSFAGEGRVLVASA
ncbi:MAG: Tetratricopeptide 2 repeat protein [Labilithrix sp.]|nr:Tetratricopeptide 2 repeat protein [Labilithrix sp.]